MVDALASGASVRKDVEVRVFSWAPNTPIFYHNNISLSKLGQRDHPLDPQFSDKIGVATKIAESSLL